jgi:sulfide:quinone oxidoreductase
MRALQVAPQVYATGQLFESDLQLVAKQGVRSIVDTRPDHDSPGQTSLADLAKAAEELGIALVHFPVDSGPIARDVAEAFAKVCDELKRPLLVCGDSGGRSTRIWETAESL